MSKLEGLLKSERQINKYGYNLNILKRTNMDRQPADSNGRSHLQSPSGRLKPKKREDGARSYRTFQYVLLYYHLVPGEASN